MQDLSPVVLNLFWVALVIGVALELFMPKNHASENRWLGQSYLQSLVLTMLSAWLCLRFPDISVSIGLISGIVVIKAAQRFSKSDTPNSSCLNIMLPLSWLSGWAWLNVSGANTGLYHVMFASVSVSVLLSGVYRMIPVSANSTVEQVIKPVAFIASVLLAMLLILQSVLLSPQLTGWAWVLAGGALSGYLLQRVSVLSTQPLFSGLMGLGVIGIITLAASRLLGTTAWPIVVIGLLATHTSLASQSNQSKIWMMAGLFLLARTVLQVYLSQYNFNVTGINITHPYASAALLGGLLLPFIFPAILKSLSNTVTPMVQGTLVMLFLVMLPLLSSYFLHAEATGSFLTAVALGALGVGLFGSAQHSDASPDWLLLPLLMITSALLGASLLDAGVNADKAQKLWILGVLFVMSLAISTFLKSQFLKRDSIQIAG